MQGLYETFKKILPNGHHRYCTRHIYANFYKKFKCLLLKKKVWKVATARTKSGWIDALEDLKKSCEKAVTGCMMGQRNLDQEPLH